MKLRKTVAVGLDITDEAISWVELSRRRDRIDVDSVGGRRFSKPLGVEFDTTTDDEIGEAIREVTANFVSPRPCIAVGLALEWMSCRLIHLGATLGEEEIEFHVSRAIGAATKPFAERGEHMLFDYRVIGCCPFDLTLIDVLCLTTVGQIPGRIVSQLGFEPVHIDVDAWVIARALARGGFSFPVFVRLKEQREESDVGVLIDPARHGRPAVPGRLVTAETSGSASAYGARHQPSDRTRLLELSPEYLRRISCDVLDLDARTMSKLISDERVDACAVSADRAVAALLAFEVLMRNVPVAGSSAKRFAPGSWR